MTTEHMFDVYLDDARRAVGHMPDGYTATVSVRVLRFLIAQTEEHRHCEEHEAALQKLRDTCKDKLADLRGWIEELEKDRLADLRGWIEELEKETAE